MVSVRPRAGNSAGADYASGGGSFGRWTTDEFGLPAYRYEPDQRNGRISGTVRELRRNVSERRA